VLVNISLLVYQIDRGNKPTTTIPHSLELNNKADAVKINIQYIKHSNTFNYNKHKNNITPTCYGKGYIIRC
jgi:hypothetical protein